MIVTQLHSHARRICPVIATGLALIANVATGAPAQTQVAIKGLRIVAEPYNADSSMRPFNWFDGTTLVLQITHPDGGLIVFDHDASRLDRFVDDRGTDLLAKQQDPGQAFSASGFEREADISGDGTTALLELSGPSLPTDGATTIQAEGTAVFHTATSQTTFAHDGLVVRPDEEFSVGPIAFILTESGKPAWGSDPLEVTIETKQDTAPIAAVRFFNTNGDRIAASRTGTMTWGVLGKTTTQFTYSLGQEAKTLAVEIDYWTDMVKTEVPFDVSASVGF